MTRLEKKCFIAATGSHALLFVILLVGPAFFTGGDHVEPAHVITVIAGPPRDDVPSSGGSTTVAPPPPPERHSTPSPEPPRQETAPREEKVEHQPKTEKSFDLEAKPKPHKPALDPSELKMVHRTTKSTRKQTETRQNNEARDRELENQRRVSEQLARDIRALGKDVGKAVAVDAGPVGNGGEAATNYKDIVMSKYTLAWEPPANLEDEKTSVLVNVTIARSGRVIHTSITKPSGNPAMDKSIESVLENVTFIEPFPVSSEDPQRSYTIKFNLQAKRGLG